MADNTVPKDFNWVEARAECSLHNIFKALELGVREDVEAIKALLRPHEDIRFSVQTARSRFSVVRVDDPMRSISESVDFELAQPQIIVRNDDGVILTATLTLNNEGQCKLKVGNDELEQWQVRRMALEKLLFKNQRS
jgi:hypothetical protein